MLDKQPIPPPMQELPRVGDYRLLARIGEGGMGVVHLAQAPDGSRVALKVLRQHIIGDRESRERLAREVASLRRVTSPRVAEVIDADPWGATPYVATRYVPGLSLHEHVRRHGPVTASDLTYFAVSLLEALVAVHRVGVLHRDVKPSNVLLEGRAPVLIDFGLARLAEDPRLTQTGFLLGTPGYLAPEILYGEEATTASDVHSWAATTVFAATGRPPFGTGPALAIMDRVRRGEHDLSAVPPVMLPLLRAALAPDAADRPRTTALLAALESTMPQGTPAVASRGVATQRDDYTMPFAVAAPDQPDSGATGVLEDATRVEGPTSTGSTTPERPTMRERSTGWDPAPQTRPLTVPLQRAARAPYMQPPPPQVAPAPLPGPAPEPPLARRQRRLLRAGLFATTVLGLALAPYIALATIGVLALVLRTVSWTTESAHRRQHLRGRRRWYDGPLTLASSPWYAVIATAGTVALVAWAAFVGSVVGLVHLLFGGPTGPGLVLTGAATTAAVWWGPASRRLRTPTRRLLRRVTGNAVTGWCVLALVTITAGLCAYTLTTGGVVWAPAEGSPWRSGTLLGRVLAWL